MHAASPRRDCGDAPGVVIDHLHRRSTVGTYGKHRTTHSIMHQQVHPADRATRRKRHHRIGAMPQGGIHEPRTQLAAAVHLGDGDSHDPDSRQPSRNMVEQHTVSLDDNTLLQRHVQLVSDKAAHQGRLVLLFVFVFAWQVCMCDVTVILSEMRHVSERVVARLSMVAVACAGLYSSISWGTSTEALTASFKDAQFLTFCMSFADIVIQVITETKVPSIGRLCGFAVSAVMLLYLQMIITGLVYAVIADSSDNPKRPSILSPCIGSANRVPVH